MQPSAAQPDPLTVRVGDIEIAYRVEGGGPPLLLIMGYAGSMQLWDPVLLARLSRRYQVISFDNRGVGLTPPGSALFTIEQFAADTAGLIQSLGLGRTHVLGYSMGGFIAQELALRQPNLVDKLILYATSPGGSEAVPGDVAVLRQLFDTSGTVQEQIERASRLLVPPEWLARSGSVTLPIFARATEPVMPRTMHQQAAAMLNWGGSFSRLETIVAPSLLVAGAEDTIIPPANALLLASAIANAWLVRLAGGGHGLMYQYPRRLARVVQDFLA